MWSIFHLRLGTQIKAEKGVKAYFSIQMDQISQDILNDTVNFGILDHRNSPENNKRSSRIAFFVAEQWGWGNTSWLGPTRKQKGWPPSKVKSQHRHNTSADIVDPLCRFDTWAIKESASGQMLGPIVASHLRVWYYAAEDYAITMVFPLFQVWEKVFSYIWCVYVYTHDAIRLIW